MEKAILMADIHYTLQWQDRELLISLISNNNIVISTYFDLESITISNLSTTNHNYALPLVFLGHDFITTVNSFLLFKI